jgi:uncharacterized protein
MHDRLIIFCRYPIPGKTKTRLIPAVGALRATDLHRRLAEETFAKTREFASEFSVDLEVCFEEGSREQMRRWLGPISFLSMQTGEGLGRCMHHAFQEAFKQGCKKVVLIGTDVPGASIEHFRFAFNALDKNDMVIGPAHDGGYWLIGLTQPVDVFSGIQWGGNTVLKSTSDHAKKIGIKPAFLDPLLDIDTIDDVNAWQPDESRPTPYLSIIIPAINEEENIERTIAHARGENSEIIVVDGGSRDRTTTIAVEAGARVISSAGGRALQQNEGAEASHGKVLLFLHADTLLPEGYLALVFEALMEHGVAAGAFRFGTDINTHLMKMIALLVNARSKYLSLPYGDQAIFLRQPMFKSVGGFPDVPIAEDLYLIRRLWRSGNIRIVSASVITSGRRWKRLGIIKTTAINAIILASCLAGVKPKRLAGLYHGKSLYITPHPDLSPQGGKEGK